MCYWRDEKYFLGHDCRLRGRKSKLYRIELEEKNESPPYEEDEVLEKEVQTEVAHISLNALTGVDDYQTLRITGHKGSISLQILMDTGSTHNSCITI